MVYDTYMITIDIDKLESPYYDAIEHFWEMNNHLTNEQYIEKFQNQFRCKADKRGDGGWNMVFKDEDYTWFVLRWS